MAARPRIRISRAEKSEATRRALIEAAAVVVGEMGYNGASIARITMAANVAQGTIYNYFESREDLFSHLLPEVGRMMVECIAVHVRNEGSLAAKERGRIRGFLEFLRNHRGFYRVLQEAEIFVPKAHRKHMENMVTGYVRALRQDILREGRKPPSDSDLEAVVLMLLGARNYVAMKYFSNGSCPDEQIDHIVDVYMRLVEGGLYRLAGPCRDPARDI